MKNLAAVAGALLAVAVALAPMLARGGAFRDLEPGSGAPQEPILVSSAQAARRAAAERGAPAAPARVRKEPRGLKSALEGHDLIVAGQVSDVNDGPNPPSWLSRQSARWQIATVAVSAVLRGGPVQFAQVWFPEGRIGAWAAAPRFAIGEKGVWLLSACKETGFGRCRPGGYMASKPKDFQPLDRVRAIEAALKS